MPPCFRCRYAAVTTPLEPLPPLVTTAATSTVDAIAATPPLPSPRDYADAALRLPPLAADFSLAFAPTDIDAAAAAAAAVCHVIVTLPH